MATSLVGTTSAHAENTPDTWPSAVLSGNYLRARGEYLRQRILTEKKTELPPRTRRILLRRPGVSDAAGTTSAHAENTGGGAAADPGSGNYLRARGEYPQL